MNYQKKLPNHVIEIAKLNSIEHPECCNYYAWPQAFGSTCGPRKGIGGQAITSFTVEAFVYDDPTLTIYVCAGMFHVETGLFEFGKHIERWKVIPGTNINQKTQEQK